MEQSEIDAFDKLINDLELGVEYEQAISRKFFLRSILLQVKALKMKFVAKERTPEKTPEPTATTTNK